MQNLGHKFEFISGVCVRVCDSVHRVYCTQWSTVRVGLKVCVFHKRKETANNNNNNDHDYEFIILMCVHFNRSFPFNFGVTTNELNRTE